VLFGLSSAACRALSEEIRTGRAVKRYLGIAAGTDLPDAFEARQPIGLVPHGLLGLVHAAAPDGKPSLTRFRVLARDPVRRRTLVLADLVTGRTHQIRIHLAACGAPLEGDPFYAPGGLPIPGTEALPSDTGYLLHAWMIALAHPAGGTLSVAAPVPRCYREGAFGPEALGAAEMSPAS
jgi:23S rRNA pseudouridine1911/1915/1917 synthase